ncbi:acetate/propionate family kinase [Methylobacter sp. S3L5C]|uniref:acetate/propionate family kinase n=1 Tax=Methylobacter sp. S3L5C TaxID=2839024 RepID=UPI001FAC8217|nr:acetate/propionate family kinase [Methylobacter sp. S3L5C]UOA09810.1 acetate/propionate family kinase [Methylobacter sp. S3L5C]
MHKYLLVINAGSSSIKFAIYRKDTPSVKLITDAAGQIEGIGSQPHFMVKTPDDLILIDRALTVDEAGDHSGAITILLSWLRAYLANGTLLAVGHRVVHGGQYYSAPVLINPGVLTELESLIPLAPLHQPHNLAAIRALLKTMPSMPQVACFDTAFHRTQPPVAQHFAIPRHLTDEGIRHYGFHGLSYEYIASILPTVEPALTNARVIVAHLGSGASLCGLYKGNSIATTMSFSPLDGLVMGTRCGSIDPGVLLYLMDHHNMDARALEQLLYHQSGLLGVSGISNDMRLLLASNHPHAEEAIELFVYRIGREIGSLTAALGGLDALVFTGGIGEHCAVIRAKICYQALWLGLQLDDAANEAGTVRISTLSSKISAWVIATEENLMIAHHTLEQVNSNGDKQ